MYISCTLPVLHSYTNTGIAVSAKPALFATHAHRYFQQHSTHTNVPIPTALCTMRGNVKHMH
jgi:hypothetical protein